MKKLSVFLPLAFFLFVIGCTPKKDKYAYVTVPNDPTNGRIYTLANGLTVYISQYTAEPRIQALIATKAGSKFDPHDATGLAHYLEHMLFKGTDKMMTAIGSRGTNAFTSVEQTVFQEDIPSNELEPYLQIESDRFHNPEM